MIILELWDQAAAKLAELIQTSPDQWSYIQQYISCQIRSCKVKRKESLESEGCSLEADNVGKVAGGCCGLDGKCSPDCGDDEGDVWKDVDCKKCLWKDLV